MPILFKSLSTNILTIKSPTILQPTVIILLGKRIGIVIKIDVAKTKIRGIINLKERRIKISIKTSGLGVI